MTTRKHHNTERIFVTSPGFDIAATSRMATYFNAILVRVRPEDFLKSLLLEKIKKQAVNKQQFLTDTNTRKQ